MKILLLSRQEVQSSLSMEGAIAQVKKAFIALSKGEVIAPLRTNLKNEKGTLLYKPAFLKNPQIFGMKAVSVFPKNLQENLPVTTGLMLLNCAKTGLPLALLDAEWLTALRTGAASGVATDAFANSEAKIAAIIGAGGQAPTQIKGVCSVRNIEEFYIFSLNIQESQKLAKQMQTKVNAKLIPCENQNMLKKCQIICTATTSPKAVFDDKYIQNGTHINGIGSFTPQMAEIPPNSWARANIIVDERKACLAEAGDLLQAIKKGKVEKDSKLVEIGEILSKKETLQSKGKEITIFKSVGNAAQDIICASQILENAKKRNLGKWVSL